MGQLKHPNGLTSVQLFVASAIFIIATGFLFSAHSITSPLPEKKYKYEIRVTNFWGSRWYNCDSYQRNGNSIKCFEKNRLVVEIIITEGYRIIIWQKF